MAEKKAATNNGVKAITLKNEQGKFYVLDFNRASVKFAEARGFKVQALQEGINMSSIEDLFFYSFRMNHPDMSKADTDKILYEELGGLREGMIERLVELYLKPFNTLITSEDSVKNSKMTVEF